MIMKKSRGIAILAAVLIILAGLAYSASIILSSTGKGENHNIKLGLDLAGGVSITYQVTNDNPTDEEMNDTVYKLQKRIESYSTEGQVYKQGDDRITVEIPGVTDANQILEDLGTPGSLEFRDPDGNVCLTGDDVETAKAVAQTNKMGSTEYVVDLKFNEEGTKKFADLTSAHVGEVCPIVYDEQTISMPRVNEAIGMESYEEAEARASNIRIGSLSLTLQELQSEVVGAQLGTEAISTSLQAAAIGLAFVAVFMIAYYWIAGVAATIALAVYSTLVVAVIYLFDITLTLPGIAGIILSIGMAVDANVIIFARIREEIASGKTVRTSIETGFKKALSAILDGNITTLIAAAVLGIKGSGTVKGFAYTLAIGIILSMFTALVVTRFLVRALYAVGFKDAKFYGKSKERKVLSFVSKRHVFYIISLAVIAAGFIGMGVNKANGKGALNLSLEFVGGTSTTADFDKNYTLNEIDSEIVPKIQEVVGNGEIQTQKIQNSNQIVFKTRNLDLDEREALNKALVDNFGVDEKTISSNSISSTISSEMTSDAVWAVIISTIFMLIYIWFRFNDLRFATSAILALLHAVLVVMTCYSLLRISVGSMFIACILPICGYSLNDTILVFDRIRETLKNVRTRDEEALKEIADKSINQTISRSINTSLTTFVMVFLLWLLGVTSIKDFALPLMVGIVSGTYSSICIATNLWYSFHKFGFAHAKKGEPDKKQKNTKKKNK